MDPVKIAQLKGQLNSMKQRIDELKKKDTILPGLTPIERSQMQTLIKEYNALVAKIKSPG